MVTRTYPLPNYIIDWILGQAFQGYPGIQVGTNIQVSDLVYADVLLSNSYWKACLKQLMVMLQHTLWRFENYGNVSTHPL